MLRERLASAVRRERDRRGWTQRDTAEAAGITNRTLQRIEYGLGAHIDTVEALCAAFDIDVVQLLRRPRVRR